MFVCCLAEAKDKWDERIDFEALWQSVTGEPMSVKLPVDNMKILFQSLEGFGVD